MNITLAGYEHNADGNLFSSHSVQINSVSFTENLCTLSETSVRTSSFHSRSPSGPSGSVIRAVAYEPASDGL